MLLLYESTLIGGIYLSKLYQNPYQNEPEKQRNRVVLNESTTLSKPLKLLHFFTLNIAVFFALGLWHSRGQRFDPAYLHHTHRLVQENRCNRKITAVFLLIYSRL